MSSANAGDHAESDDVRHRPGEASAKVRSKPGRMSLGHPRKLQATRRYRSRLYPRSTHFDTQVGFNRLAHSAKRSGSFVRDDKLAFMSPSKDDYDQETDPRTNHGCRETANV